MNKSRDINQTASGVLTRIAEAKQKFSSGQVDASEAVLRDVLRSHPRETQAYVALGIIAAERDQPNVAVEQMTQALAIDPNCVPAMIWLSFLYRTQDQIVQAVPYARRAVELSPNDPYALYEFAETLEAAGNERASADMLRRAVLVGPTLAGLSKLAALELGLGTLEDAERYCRRALSKQPESGDLHVLMGRILTERERMSEAETHWEAAARLDATPGNLHLQRALSRAAIGHFDTAVEELTESIRTNPVQGGAYQALVYAKRIQPKDLPLVEQMTQIESTCDLPEKQRLSLLYALGKSFDNLGEFEKAMSYFDRANELNVRLRGGEMFDRDAFKALIDDRIRVFTPELIRSFARTDSQPDLPILIIGMMRSGTTLAEQMLSCHPLVGGAGEQRYWGENDASIVDYIHARIDSRRLGACAREYVQLLKAAAPGFTRVIDKNPANLLVAGSFHLAFPKANILLTRRNAIDTALSIWMTPMSTTAAFVGNRENIVFAYQQCARLMDHWREVLPQDQFLEVPYEDLVANPEGHAKKIVAFCRLDWDAACLHPENNQRRIKTPSFWQVRQPIYSSSTQRWKNYEPWLGAFRDLEGAA